MSDAVFEQHHLEGVVLEVEVLQGFCKDCFDLGNVLHWSLDLGFIDFLHECSEYGVFVLDGLSQIFPVELLLDLLVDHS